jgi:hypothetical protein
MNIRTVTAAAYARMIVDPIVNFFVASFAGTATKVVEFFFADFAEAGLLWNIVLLISVQTASRACAMIPLVILFGTINEAEIQSDLHSQIHQRQDYAHEVKIQSRENHQDGESRNDG